MDGHSKQFSRSRDSYHRTAEKTFTKHHASQHIERSGSEFDHRSDFEEYLKSQCHQLVCEVEEYRHSNEMDGCTIKFLNEEMQARDKELKQLAKQLTAKQLALEQLLKKYNALKQEATKLRQQMQCNTEHDRKEKHLKTKTHDQLAYLTDKLNRTMREAEQLKEFNRSVKEESLAKQDRIIELQRQNGLLMRQLENVKIQLDHLSSRDQQIVRQVEHLTAKLAHSERDKIDAMARVRQLEKERSELTLYLDQKDVVESSIKQKDTQLQQLTKRLSEVELKLQELSHMNDKLNFQLKHSHAERQLERSAYESQLGNLRERLVCQPSQRQPHIPFPVMAQSTYFGRDPRGRTYRQQQQEIKVIESLPSQSSIDEINDQLFSNPSGGDSIPKRVVGGIARKSPAARDFQLQRLINRYEQLNRRNQERQLFCS